MPTPMAEKIPELNPGIERYKVIKPIYYREQTNEVLTSLRAYAADIPLVYKGPTGSGKSTLAEHLCFLLGVGWEELKQKYGERLTTASISKLETKSKQFRDGFPLVTVGGNEDLDADTLKGMLCPVGDQVYWLNGIAKLAAQYGGIFYFDEPAEARPDTLVVVHSLSDHRRILPVEKLGEIYSAHPSFGFVMSYNEKYQDPRKRFKPSTSQRFVHIPIGYPKADVEMEIVRTHTPIDEDIARKLIRIAEGTRKMADQKELKEGASPREVINAAKLIGEGASPLEAAYIALATPITDEPEKLKAIEDLIKNQFKK